MSRRVMARQPPHALSHHRSHRPHHRTRPAGVVVGHTAKNAYILTNLTRVLLSRTDQHQHAMDSDSDSDSEDGAADGIADNTADNTADATAASTPSPTPDAPIAGAIADGAIRDNELIRDKAGDGSMPGGDGEWEDTSDDDDDDDDDDKDDEAGEGGSGDSDLAGATGDPQHWFPDTTAASAPSPTPDDATAASAPLPTPGDMPVKKTCDILPIGDYADGFLRDDSACEDDDAR